jgi:hypothetical protein
MLRSSVHKGSFRARWRVRVRCQSPVT